MKFCKIDILFLICQTFASFCDLTKMADIVNPYFENYDNEDCDTQDKLYEDFSDAVKQDGLLLRFLPKNVVRDLIHDYQYELRLECEECPSIFICAVKQKKWN